MWDLAYNGSQHTFHFFPYTATGAPRSAPGPTPCRPTRGSRSRSSTRRPPPAGRGSTSTTRRRRAGAVTGDYTRSTNYQRLQLWNDGAETADFDDVVRRDAAGSGDRPRCADGRGRDPRRHLRGAVSWTAPASDGGGPITSYRITPVHRRERADPDPHRRLPTRPGHHGPRRTARRTRSGWPRPTRSGRAPTRPPRPRSRRGPAYTSVVFSDGFESGNLSAWDGLLGNGTATVIAGAAQPAPSASSFRMRRSSSRRSRRGCRRRSSTAHEVLDQGRGRHRVPDRRAGPRRRERGPHVGPRLRRRPSTRCRSTAYTATGSNQISTGANTVPANTWVQVEVQYTATASGGARIYVNGQTQAELGASTGDYTRSDEPPAPAALERRRLDDGLRRRDASPRRAGTGRAARRADRTSPAPPATRRST